MQAKLLRLTISVVTIATFFAALHGYRNSQSHLNKLFDKELVTVTHFMAASDNFSPQPADPTNSFLYQIFDKQNRLIAKASDAPEYPIASIAKGFTEVAFNRSQWRVYVVSTDVKRVLVAQSMTERKSTADDILLVTITPIVFSIPIIGLLIFYVVRKSLAPLRLLSRQLRNKNSEDLSPVKISHPTKELVPVVDRLNDVFAKLNDAFELEKQVSANAAHELRTPVSVLSIAVNNLATAFANNNITEKQLRELTQGVARMANVIEQIINLFRFTPENFANKLSQVDIEKILQEVITNNYSALEEAKQSIELNSQPSLTYADPFALYILLENIVRNAIKYAGEGAHISITVHESYNRLLIDFDDSGKGLLEEERQQLTQRFYRASNQTDVKGSGLGLAIVKRIADLHGASITFEEAPTSGLRVRVSLKKAKGDRSGA
ncbi:ATP-binding protein [Paraglaciecola marina]|uniref:ATP-binding protein n=1 Tax=Paraglaciecola marina TaxID=2500157 RepID=UPI001061C74E|nr:ATP-binding protein [Paraglaciecola marina]